MEFLKIPTELKALKQWVCYKLIPQKKGKDKKLPISPIDGRAGDPTDLNRCVSFREAVNFLNSNKELKGLMFLIHKSDPYTGIDLDDCVSKYVPEDFAQEILNRFPDTYAEYSVSRTGLHIVIKGILPKKYRRSGKIEMYDCDRYLVMTGEAFTNREKVLDYQEELNKFHSEVFAQKLKQDREAKKIVRENIENDLDCQEIIGLINNSKSASKFNSLYSGDLSIFGGDHSACDQSLCNILAFYCGGDKIKMDTIFRSSGLNRDKWNRNNYREDTLNRAISSCTGSFYSSQYNKTKKEKTTQKQAEKKVEDNLPPIVEIKPKGIDEKFVFECLDDFEFGDATLFARMNEQKFVYDNSSKRWYYFERCWREDKTFLIIPEIRNCLVGQYKFYFEKYSRLQNKTENQSLDLKDDADIEIAKGKAKRYKKIKGKFAERLFILKRLSHINNIEKILQKGGFLGISGEEWDQFPLHIGSRNGYLISLETGKVRQQYPSDYIRKIANADWKGLNEPCPMWEKFQKNIYLEHADEISEFKRRLFGLSILGKVQEHVFPIIYGEEGRNGKETEFETIREVFGSLAKPISRDVIMSSKTPNRGAPEPELYNLWGVRIAWLSETEEGHSLNISRIKHLSGGGTISCRPLHGNPVEFEPSQSLFVFTNHKPHAPSDDPSLWERIILINYPIHFCDYPRKKNDRKKNPKIRDELKKEKSGIFSWFVRGAIEYQKEGLKIPDCILEDTAQYRREEDIIERWIEDFAFVCEDKSLAKQYEYGCSNAFKDFKEWCIESNYRPLGLQKFSQRMTRKFEKKARNIGNFYVGICRREKVYHEQSKQEVDKTLF